MGVAGLLVGLAVGALGTVRPAQVPVPITVDSFPRELLGLTRPDVGRSDAEFADQLAGHRFAHGGDGASLSYGGLYTLTIVNGRLTPTVPTSGDRAAGRAAVVVSLRSTRTSCVSQQSILEFTPAATDTAPRAASAAGGDGGFNASRGLVWTECVLEDAGRNIALRLVGPGPTGSVLVTAPQFRDELERVQDVITHQ